MDANKLEYLSAAELGREVNAKNVSPVEVVDYFQKRIERINPTINALVYTKFDYAREQAKLICEKLAKGQSVGEFAGVPFGLKDFLPSKKGWTNSHGGVKSLIKEDQFNSAFCTAMESAGGIAIGKTNAPAFGFRGTCDNVLYGATKNPFNTEYNSGGSSGGSAAAVAAGLLPISEGSDGGGSIRIPAAWCNCFGFKPSVGTVPDIKRPDAWAATHPYCVNGGITKTVEDSAILLNYMAAYNPKDPVSVKRGTKDFTAEINKPIKGLRIAFTADFGVFSVEDEVKESVLNAAKRFALQGATVEEINISIPYTCAELAAAWCASISVDTAIELKLMKENGLDLVGAHSDELPEQFIYWNKKVAKATIYDYYEFNKMRTAILDAQQKVFDNFDLIISPTTACLPVKNSKVKGETVGPEYINGQKAERLIGFCETFFENFTGNPAASVPAGLSKSGLPIGMQIIGKKYEDAEVLRASAAYEKIYNWRKDYK